MFSFLFRCCLFIAGLVFIADTGLPTRIEQVRVDQHTSQVNSDRRGTGAGDTSYTLHLTGGVVNKCSVGHALYMRLKDGDGIEVWSTRLFKNCIRISQGDAVFEDDKYWKLIGLVLGALMIAIAVGWLRSDDDDRGGISVRLG